MSFIWFVTIKTKSSIENHQSKNSKIDSSNRQLLKLNFPLKLNNYKSISKLHLNLLTLAPRRESVDKSFENNLNIGYTNCPYLLNAFSLMSLFRLPCRHPTFFYISSYNTLISQKTLL